MSSWSWYQREHLSHAQLVKEKILKSGFVGPRVSLVEGIAQSVEDFTVVGDDAMTTNLLNYLQDGNLDRGSNFNRNFNSQVETKTLLLEHLANAIGCTPSERFNSPRIPSVEVIHHTLKPIVRYAAQWPRSLQALGQHLSHPQAPVDTVAEVIHPDSSRPTSNPMMTTLSLLSQSRVKLNKADRLIAEANVLLIAFMVFWHSSHNTPVPRHKEDFFAELMALSQRRGLSTFPPEILDAMTGPASADLFEGLKIAVEVAVHISPLALLNSINYTRFSIDRRVLIKWGQDLGPKPVYILATEAILWNAIMDIASGTGVREALVTFVEDCRPNHNMLLEKEGELGAFFVNGSLKKDSAEGLSAEGAPVAVSSAAAMSITQASSSAVGDGDEPRFVAPASAPMSPPDDVSQGRGRDGLLDVGAGATESGTATADEPRVDPINADNAARDAASGQRSPSPLPDASNGAASDATLEHDASDLNAGTINDPADDLKGTGGGEPGAGLEPASTSSMLDTNQDGGTHASRELAGGAGTTGGPATQHDDDDAALIAPLPLNDNLHMDICSPDVPTGLSLDRTESPLSDLSEDSEDAPADPAPVPDITPVLGRRVRKVVKYAGMASVPASPVKKKRKLEGGPGTVRASVTPPPNIKREVFWATTQNLYDNAAIAVESFQQSFTQSHTKRGRKKTGAPHHSHTPRSEVGVDLTVFDESCADAQPTTYTFQPDKNSAEFDIPLVRKIAEGVHSLFDKEGRPPHRLPAASLETVGGKTSKSSIFSVEYSRFIAMDTSAIQRIFRHRHILVTKVPSAGTVRFDREGLQMLADVEELVTIQHSNLKKNQNRNAMNLRAPFKTLLSHIQKDTAVALNVLDLPLGHSTVPVPPKFNDLASEAYCANSARMLIDLKDLSDSTSWGTAATRDASSWFHSDDDGFCTSVYVQVGDKLWVLARLKNEWAGRDEMGNMGTFAKWEVDSIDTKVWDLEAVHLDPRCVLFMKPSTPHFVLGMDSTIVLGRHFYASSAIRRSCFGIVHALVLGSGITNTFHEDDTRSLLRQIMGAWYRHFVLHEGFGRVAEHIPDIRHEVGLLDVVALGCVLEFATALNRFRYHSKYDADDQGAIQDLEQESLSRTFFRVIMKTFGHRYVLNIGGALVHPAHVWQSILVRFAVVIVGYMNLKAKEVRKEPGLTPEALEKQLRLHFQTDYPHLLPAFNAALSDAPVPLELLWDGPTIKVIQRTDASQSFLRAAGGMEYRSNRDWPLWRDDLFLNCEPVNKFYEEHWPHEESDDEDAAA